MHFQFNTLCLLLAAKPTFSFNFLGIFGQPEPESLTKTRETDEEFLARYQVGCPVHKYDGVRMVSRKPEIMLIDGFLSEREADVLLNLACAPTTLRDV